MKTNTPRVSTLYLKSIHCSSFVALRLRICQKLLMGWFFYCAVTGEVLLRSFALGFGLRMLKYILWEDCTSLASNNGNDINESASGDSAEKTLQNLPLQLQVSGIPGLAMASFIFRDRSRYQIQQAKTQKLEQQWRTYLKNNRLKITTEQTDSAWEML